MKTIDTAVLAGYNAGIERDRLRSGIGIIEFERTKEILLEKLPKPPAVIYDIGGAYGEYAWWLASLGYEVHLFDLSETNIAMSEELATEYPGVKLASATVNDARSIPRPDKSADAVLLMGPLYSVTEYEERILAIRESRRLLKDDGILFSAALTPFSVLVPRIALYHIDDSKKRKELDDPAVISMIERALEDGCYINPEKKIASGLGSSHLHTAKALRAELSMGGFDTDTVHGVMGGAWLAPNLDELLANEETKAASKLQRRDPAYEYHMEEINQIFAANPKLVGVLERGEITALGESDVEDLVRVIDLHMSSDIMFRKAIYHEGVLNGLRMQKYCS